eukprot:1051615-Pelagomonas_calceolata.AAC.1
MEKPLCWVLKGWQSEQTKQKLAHLASILVCVLEQEQEDKNTLLAAHQARTANMRVLGNLVVPASQGRRRGGSAEMYWQATAQ